MTLDHTAARTVSQADSDQGANAQIVTDRFILRVPRTSDVGLLGLYASDERVAKASRSIPFPLPPGATEAFLQRCMHPDQSKLTWVMDGAENGLSEVLGLISLKPIEREQCEVTFWVAPAFWGTGIASAAVNAIVDANPLGVKTIFAEIFQDNQASARVVTNAGFAYLGDAETFSIARGARVPTWTYVRKID
jgi:RimJ/RimL family protein N-acetyltransferase